MPGCPPCSAACSSPLSACSPADPARVVDAQLIGNAVVDLAPLAGAVSLVNLNVSDNPLSGLQGLEALPGLQSLTATNAGLKALVPVAPKSLEHLDLGENKLTDVTPLAAHQDLARVVLDGNLLKDLAPLEKAPWVLVGCASLSVHANPLGALTLETTMPALCGHDMTIFWDQGECAGRALRLQPALKLPTARGAAHAGAALVASRWPPRRGRGADAREAGRRVPPLTRRRTVVRPRTQVRARPLPHHGQAPSMCGGGAGGRREPVRVGPRPSHTMPPAPRSSGLDVSGAGS